MVASPDGQLLLRLNDAARALSISPSLLRRMTKSGTIPVVRMGCRLLYDPDALRAFIKRAAAEPYEPCASLRR
jgi:excisionase family DNA binding protein